MENNELQFWQLYYKILNLAERSTFSARKTKRFSEETQELTRYFWNRLRDESLVKSTKSDKTWWTKTCGVFEKSVKNGLTHQDLKEIIELAFAEKGYRKYMFYAGGIIRNFESKWLQQPKALPTIGDRNLERFLS